MAPMAALESRLAALRSVSSRARRLHELVAATETLARSPLSPELETNLSHLGRLFDRCSDWAAHRFEIGEGPSAAVCFLDDLVDLESLHDLVLKPLLAGGPAAGREDGFRSGEAPYSSLCLWARRRLPQTQMRESASLRDLVDAALSAHVILLVDGADTALLIELPGYAIRSISEPKIEPAIRGPREGFVEDLSTNRILLRRRVRTPLLKLEQMRVGRLTQTELTLAYIDGLVPLALIDEIKRRIGEIDIDGVLEGAYIEEFIEDHPDSPFPQLMNTERPDALAGHLLEGRAAILVDGSPFALVMPMTFWGFLQAAEDFYDRFYTGTALRWIRYLFGSIALLGPSIYVAVTTFHQEMLPTPLLFTLMAAREGIPFPSVVEAIVMEVVFEALREAGVRLPVPVGQAVTIVGALVIGQAAVQAGLVSATMVIVVAATGIASFTFPRFNFGIAIRLIRFPMILLSATLGLFGITIGLLAILTHLCAMRSFGVPYLSPVSPLSLSDLADVAVRPPIWARGPRPRPAFRLNPARQQPRPNPETGRRPDGAQEGTK